MILKICLCLSHKITEEGVLSNDAKSRVETASKIFKSEGLPRIIFIFIFIYSPVVVCSKQTLAAMSFLK